MGRKKIVDGKVHKSVRLDQCDLDYLETKVDGKNFSDRIRTLIYYHKVFVRLLKKGNTQRDEFQEAVKALQIRLEDRKVKI